MKNAKPQRLKRTVTTVQTSKIKITGSLKS